MARQRFTTRDETTTDLLKVPDVTEVAVGSSNLTLDVLSSDPTSPANGEVWLLSDGSLSTRAGGSTANIVANGETASNKNVSGGYPGLSVFKLQLLNTGGVQTAGSITSTLEYDIDGSNPIAFSLQQNLDVETDQAGTIPVMRDITSGDEANIRVDVLSSDPTTQADGDLWLLSTPAFWARVSGVDYGIKLYADPEVVDFTDMLSDGHRGGSQTISATGTISAVDQLILASNTISVTLPTPSASISGREYVIVNNDTGVITITNTISGTASRTLAAQYNYIRVQCDTVNWYMVGSG
jgi:hypothetical protein